MDSDEEYDRIVEEEYMARYGPEKTDEDYEVQHAWATYHEKVQQAALIVPQVPEVHHKRGDGTPALQDARPSTARDKEDGGAVAEVRSCVCARGAKTGRVAESVNFRVIMRSLTIIIVTALVCVALLRSVVIINVRRF